MPSPREHNHYRIFSGNECYANVTRMLRFRNIHFPEIGGQKCISPLWHRAFMHIVATKTETAIFFKDCQSAKWRVKNQRLSPVGLHAFVFRHSRGEHPMRFLKYLRKNDADS